MTACDGGGDDIYCLARLDFGFLGRRFHQGLLAVVSVSRAHFWLAQRLSLQFFFA